MCNAESDYWVASSPSTVLALLDRIEELTTTLYRAREALGEYACHIGDKYPCMRLPDQCRAECGKAAGDAALLIDKALSGEKR